MKTTNDTICISDGQCFDETSFVPEWRGSLVGWTMKHVSINSWRVDFMYSEDDLLQEAFLIFAEIKHKYCDSPEEFNHREVTNAKWFMHLYKTSWMRRFTDICRYSRPRSCMSKMSDFATPDDETNFVIEGFEDGTGQLAAKIDQAPQMIQDAFSLILNAPSELVDSLHSSWKERGKLKFMANSFICECLGLNPVKVDLVKMIKDYLNDSIPVDIHEIVPAFVNGECSLFDIPFTKKEMKACLSSYGYGNSGIGYSINKYGFFVPKFGGKRGISSD